MAESLKGWLEEYEELSEALDKLSSREEVAKLIAEGKITGPAEATNLANSTQARLAEVATEYNRLRTEALRTVKASRYYQPGTIIVLNGEQFTENEHGDFVRIK
jgi:hypothetical protein